MGGWINCENRYYFTLYFTSGIFKKADSGPDPDAFFSGPSVRYDVKNNVSMLYVHSSLVVFVFKAYV